MSPLRTWQQLPRPVRRVLLGELLSAAGSGAVLPFLAVFVAQVRDQGVQLGGLAVAAVAIGAMAANPVAGRLVDATGARRVLQAGLVLTAAGDIALIFSYGPVALLGASALFGVGAGTALPALHALVGAATPPEHRPTAFAVKYALLNVGFGVGAMVAALVVDFAEPATFHLLYALDAATFLLYAAWLQLPMSELTATGVERDDAVASGAGYREVMANRPFRRLCLVTGLLVVCGFAQYHAALPAFAGREGGLTASQLAVVFGLNTVVVALLQIPVLRATKRVPRQRLILLGGGCFAGCWLLVLSSAPYGGAGTALVLVAGAAAVMAVGETLLSPALGPLVNEMAPEHLRGRYNAVDTFILSAGSAVGPAATGLLLAGGYVLPLFVGLAAGCVLAGMLALTLRPTSTVAATVAAPVG